MFTRYFRFHLQDGKRGKGRNVEISSSSKTSNPLNEKGAGEVSVDHKILMSNVIPDFMFDEVVLKVLLCTKKYLKLT